MRAAYQREDAKKAETVLDFVGQNDGDDGRLEVPGNGRKRAV